MSDTETHWIEICPGIRRRTLVHGQTMYQMQAHLAADSRMAEHHHPQEQIVHVIKGRVRLIVAGIPHELTAGQSHYLASDVPHGVETLEETTIVDTFSPPRDDYIALDRKAKA